MHDPRRVLLIGFGNPARGDDGLGPALARSIAARAPEGVTVEWPYHLQVEDAATIADHDVVIFADADADASAPFAARHLAPGGVPSWTTHTLGPEVALALARDIFGAAPPAVLLGVRGYEFDAFREGLSAGAGENLSAAIAWLEPRLQDGGRELLATLAAAPIGG